MKKDTANHQNDICPAEHFALYSTLNKMALTGSITNIEMQSILNKSGLSLIKKGYYKNKAGETLITILKQ